MVSSDGVLVASSGVMSRRSARHLGSSGTSVRHLGSSGRSARHLVVGASSGVIWSFGASSGSWCVIWGHLVDMASP